MFIVFDTTKPWTSIIACKIFKWAYTFILIHRKYMNFGTTIFCKILTFHFLANRNIILYLFFLPRVGESCSPLFIFLTFFSSKNNYIQCILLRNDIIENMIKDFLKFWSFCFYSICIFYMKLIFKSTRLLIVFCIPFAIRQPLGNHYNGCLMAKMCALVNLNTQFFNRQGHNLFSFELDTLKEDAYLILWKSFIRQREFKLHLDGASFQTNTDKLCTNNPLGKMTVI